MPIPAGSTDTVSPIVGGINTVRLVDGSTTIWLRPAQPAADDPIVCSTHEITPPAPRVVAQLRVGRSGIDDLTTLFDAAQFKASLVVRDGGGKTRHEWMAAIRALTAPHRRPWLYIQRDGWPTERRAQLRGDPYTSVIDRKSGLRVEASLQFSIPGGVLEDTVQRSVTLRPGAVTTGRSYPKTYPRSYAVASTTSSTTITLGGDVPVAPLMRFYGTFTDPVIRLVETGQVIELDNITIPAGNYLDVDVANCTVLLNGDPALNYYNKINFAATDWWLLRDGVANTVTIAVGSNDATSALDLYWTDLWLAG